MNRPARYIEFAPVRISKPEKQVNDDTLYPIPAFMLISDTDQAKGAAEMVVDDEVVDISRSVVSAIAKAITKGSEIEKAGGRVDCVAFAVLTCGGKYLAPIPVEAYAGVGTGVSREFRSTALRPVKEGGAAVPSLRPLLFGLIDHTARLTFEPRHMAVKLPAGEDLMIQKFGDSPPAIANFSNTAGYYNVTHQSVIQEINTIYKSANVLRYKAPRQDPGPYVTFRS